MNDHGKPVHYEGVFVTETLKKSGAPTGEELGCGASATYVFAKAKDGYGVVYSADRSGSGLTEAEVLLVDKTDGNPLTESPVLSGSSLLEIRSWLVPFECLGT